jgi:NADH:ubiquinone oxidoreductase subunit 1 (chain H)
VVGPLTINFLTAAIRGASQMISYELAMGLALIALLMLTGSCD